jgi:hypothetical protein
MKRLVNEFYRKEKCMNKQQTSHLEFGVLAAVGVIALAVGVDLTGKLLHFLYGEWPYICAGLVVVLFFAVNWWVYSEFGNEHRRFEKDVEKELAEYEAKFSSLRYENSCMKDQVAFVRRSLEEHWRLCERTIKQVDKLLEQKAPIVAALPAPVQATVGPELHDAVQEVVGGAV